ncbi:hypothetical protein [Azospirillum argentinense]|nr:hypothetical protein [Azospirillum argentinense]
MTLRAQDAVAADDGDDAVMAHIQVVEGAPEVEGVERGDDHPAEPAIRGVDLAAELDRPFARHPPEDGAADEQSLDRSFLVHAEMLAVGQIHPGRGVVHAALDQVALSVRVGELEQKVRIQRRVPHHVAQQRALAAQPIQIVTDEGQDAVGPGDGPRGLFRDDVGQVAGVALGPLQRVAPIALRQVEGRGPGRRGQQERGHPHPGDQRPGPERVGSVAVFGQGKGNGSVRHRALPSSGTRRRPSR